MSGWTELAAGANEGALPVVRQRPRLWVGVMALALGCNSRSSDTNTTRNTDPGSEEAAEGGSDPGSLETAVGEEEATTGLGTDGSGEDDAESEASDSDGAEKIDDAAAMEEHVGPPNEPESDAADGTDAAESDLEVEGGVAVENGAGSFRAPCSSDEDCGEGLECHCNMCTVLCTEEGECSGLGGTCEELNCAGSVCAVGCEEDTDCAVSETCEESVCMACGPLEGYLVNANDGCLEARGRLDGVCFIETGPTTSTGLSAAVCLVGPDGSVYIVDGYSYSYELAGDGWRAYAEESAEAACEEAFELSAEGYLDCLADGDGGTVCAARGGFTDAHVAHLPLCPK